MIEVISRKTFADPLQPGQEYSGAVIFENLVATVLEYVECRTVSLNIVLTYSDT